MKNKSNVSKQNWIFYASRNVPVWHNSSTINFIGRGLKKYKLPTFLIMSRIHRGFESDFYQTKDGIGSSTNIIESLTKKLESKNYLTFLKQNYLNDGRKFLTLSKKLKNNEPSLKRFFEYYGYCTALLDITLISSNILTDKITNILKNHSGLQEILAYHSIPKQLAPIQKLEKEIRQYSKNLNLENFATKLYNKYHWIPVSFVGEPWSKEYFVNLLKQKNIDHKIPAKPNFKLNKIIAKELKALANITYLNEYRKAIFSQVSLNIRPLFNELAIIAKLNDWKDIGLLTHEEILEILKTKKDMRQIVAERKKNPIIIYTTSINKFAVSGSDEVKNHEEKFKFNTTNIKEIKGTIANKGFYSGIVRVVLRHEDFDKFKNGEILVATMTSVDYMPLMKKAGALITDEGGLACHAAVVSREFNVPCIIGTKIATKVLKNGDIVEVDANIGTIKKLS